MSANEVHKDERSAHSPSFETTHWSAVLAAAGSGPTAEAALERLCGAYWYPLYVYARRTGKSVEDAQDLTQEFFSRVLEKNLFALADPSRGRFRSFLLIAMKNFMTQEWVKGQTQKRGGGRQIVSLDEQQAEERYREEPACAATPDAVFDRTFANEVLSQVMDRLKAEWAGRAIVFEELKVFLTSDVELGEYTRIAAKLGMSEKAVKTAVYRLRQRFRVLLRAEVASIVAQPEEIDDEMRALFDALAG